MMAMNPALKSLGFAKTDRVVIVHADDIGMSQATLPAVSELFAFGLVSSAAIMVPCPWFRGAAAIAEELPEADFGVHLTLNAEWEAVRWGPVSTADPAAGLSDTEGYFYRDPQETSEMADRRALRIELDAQLERAQNAGVHVTHADTHMFCLGTPDLISIYASAALSAGTLPVLMRPDGPGWRKFGLGEESTLADNLRNLEQSGLPMIDDIYMMNLDSPDGRLEEARSAFENLRPGLTHFILHPAIDSPELRAMAPDWRCRVADLDTFRDPRLKQHIADLGIQVIEYEVLRRLLPADLSTAGL